MSGFTSVEVCLVQTALESSKSVESAVIEAVRGNTHVFSAQHVFVPAESPAARLIEYAKIDLGLQSSICVVITHERFL